MTAIEQSDERGNLAGRPVAEILAAPVEPAATRPGGPAGTWATVPWGRNVTVARFAVRVVVMSVSPCLVGRAASAGHSRGQTVFR